MNFCCNEFNFKLNWYICTNTNDVVKNFAAIKSVGIKSFHCKNIQDLFFQILFEVELSLIYNCTLLRDMAISCDN